MECLQRWIVCSVLLLGLKFGLSILNYSSNVMFDTILSGCDGIRQHPSKWSGNQCDVMKIPDMEFASPVQAILSILLSVQDSAGGPAPRDGKPVPDDLAWLSTPNSLTCCTLDPRRYPLKTVRISP